MSDLMLTAVLSMPYDMAMGDEFSRRQFWDRAQQALAEIERLQVGIELIETENADLLTRLDLESGTVGMIARECADLRRQLDECSQMLARQAAAIRERDEARAERDAMAKDAERMRAALNTIARTPAMPFPDPGAHSERAYHEAVFVAWSRSNQTARAALAQIEQEKANGSR